MLVENFHNLRRLDAEASNFDLFVNPAQESNLAVGEIARQVAGFVKTRIRIGAERIADKSLRGQIRPIAVYSRHSGASNANFAGLPHRNRLHVFIQDMALDVVKWPSD